MLVCESLPPDPRIRRRLAHLDRTLHRLGTSLRFVDYRQAEHDCVRLAASLRHAIGDEELAAMEFRAIPRGGLVVLGMLAYALRLPTHCLRAGSNPEAPVVLVDDCALTGLRLRQELAAIAPRRSIVVAHLYSTPELRRAVTAADPRVEHCIAAHDLTDLSRELFPDEVERSRWRRRWRERLGDDRYWIGLPELVAFAWNEPDRPFWNDANGAVENGWRFIPPHLCFKNRLRLSSPRLPATAAARWRLPAGIVWGEFDGTVWFYRTADDELFSLTGTGAVAWKALLTESGVENASAIVGEVFDVGAKDAAGDLEALAAELVSAGLLEPSDARA